MSKVSELAELQQKRTWAITIVITVIAGFIFLTPYMGTIILALLMSYLFYPIYKWLLKVTKGKKNTSVALATIFHMLAIAIPVVLVIYYAITQGLEFVNQLGLGSLVTEGGDDFQNSIISVVDQLNEYIESLVGVTEAISEEGVVNFLQNTLPEFLKTVLDSVIGIVAGIPSFFMFLIIYLFVFVGVTLGQKNLIAKIKALSPFDDDINEMYFTKIGAMATGMVKGQFIIAFLQAIMGSLSLIPLIGSDYFIFFTILFTFMNFIPLGSGILLIPLGILALLFGNVTAGLIILGTHFLLTTNIDNILRPMLVPKAAKMPATFTILSAFAGVYYWGFLGVIYGPIIMIVLLTTIDAYIAQKEAYKTKLSKLKKA